MIRRKSYGGDTTRCRSGTRKSRGSWSHTDTATNRAWLVDAGLTVESETYVPEGEGGHTLFRARRL
jgi:hypothetical protein